MSDTRPTPETDKLQDFMPVGTVWLEHSRSLERERDEARAALSGRTVSCSQCNESAKKVTELEAKVATLESQKDQWRMSSVCREKDAEIQAMREAIKEAHAVLQRLSDYVADSHGISGYHRNGDIADWDEVELRDPTADALTKLKPFLP